MVVTVRKALGPIELLRLLEGDLLQIDCATVDRLEIQLTPSLDGDLEETLVEFGNRELYMQRALSHEV
jgi:hypothetical protein